MYPIRFSKENTIITLAAGAVIFILILLKVPCVFLTLTGVPCPGCGITHAFIALITLRLNDAFAYNPCVFLMPLFYLYFWQNGIVFRNQIINRLVIWGCLLLFILRYILLLINL